MKKLESNGLWQTKFIVPEFREAILKQQKEHKRIPRPQLDEQELDIISRAIGHSYSTGCPLHLTLYDPFEPKEITGIVIGLRQQPKQLKLAQNGDWEWINISDILKGFIDE